MRKRMSVASLILLFLSMAGWAQMPPGSPSSQLSLTVIPGMNIPLGRDTGLYSIGGGADFSVDYRMPFLPFLQAGATLGYSLAPLQAVTSLSLLGGGLEAGVRFDVGERLSFRAFGTAGYFYGFLNDGSGTGGGNPFVSGSVLASYRILPQFSVGLGAAYRYFFGLYNGATVHLAATYDLPSGRGREGAPAVERQPLPGKAEPLLRSTPEKPSPPPGSGIELTGVEFSNVFPVFYKFYNDHPIGIARLKNFEKTAASNVRLSFIAKQYMDGPKTCAVIDAIGPGEEKEVEISGLFKSTIMEISEPTLVSTTTTIEYTQAGKAQRKEIAGAIRILDRNAMTWDDDRKAAAFVTSRDPTVLKFSKNVTSMLKGKASTAIDAKLLSAIGIHEALGLYGLAYVVDPTTPHQEVSRNKETVDFLQFPVQTLEYKGGDCDDLSILYCALLESVGVETAFITIPGHIYIAFCLDDGPEAARRSYLRPDDLIFLGDKVWVPIEVTQRTGGFLKAWEAGAKEWRENEARNQASLYPTHESWAKFEAVGFSGAASSISVPSETSVVKAFTDEVTAFVDREIYERVAMLQAEINRSPDSRAAVNRLGVLYAQYGLYDRAEREFMRLVAKDYAPALLNMGTIASRRNSLREALDYYQRAFRKEPNNPRALLGLARVNHELENYGETRVAYEALRTLDPDLASRFAYLGMRGQEAVRAAEISRAREVMLWEEGR